LPVAPRFVVLAPRGSCTCLGDCHTARTVMPDQCLRLEACNPMPPPDMGQAPDRPEHRIVPCHCVGPRDYQSRGCGQVTASRESAVMVDDRLTRSGLMPSSHAPAGMRTY
jgi:hypothetical protein